MWCRRWSVDLSQDVSPGRLTMGASCTLETIDQGLSFLLQFICESVRTYARDLKIDDKGKGKRLSSRLILGCWLICFITGSCYKAHSVLCLPAPHLSNYWCSSWFSLPPSLLPCFLLLLHWQLKKKKKNAGRHLIFFNSMRIAWMFPL